MLLLIDSEYISWSYSFLSHFFYVCTTSERCEFHMKIYGMDYRTEAINPWSMDILLPEQGAVLNGPFQSSYIYKPNG